MRYVVEGEKKRGGHPRHIYKKGGEVCVHWLSCPVLTRSLAYPRTLPHLSSALHHDTLIVYAPVVRDVLTQARGLGRRMLDHGR